MEYTNKNWLIDYEDCLSIFNIIYYTLQTSDLLVNKQKTIIKEVVSQIELTKTIQQHEQISLELENIIQSYSNSIQRERELTEIKKRKQQEIDEMKEVKVFDSSLIPMKLSELNNEMKLEKENEILYLENLQEQKRRKEKQLEEFQTEKKNVMEKIISLNLHKETVIIDELLLNQRISFYQRELEKELSSFEDESNEIEENKNIQSIDDIDFSSEDDNIYESYNENDEIK